MGMLTALQAKGSPQPKQNPHNLTAGNVTATQNFKNIASAASQSGGNTTSGGFRRLKKSNSQLIFNGESDVLSRKDGIPSVVHQLRQTYAQSSKRSFYQQQAAMKDY